MLGQGRADLVKKATNVANIDLMQSAKEQDFHKTRCEVKGWTTDQGTEFGISSITVKILTQLQIVTP